MRWISSLGIAGLLVLASAAGAAAQERGKTGVTMGYPASFGIIWQVSDKLAIRPELGISGGSGNVTSSGFSTETNGWTVSTGVSALIYLRTYDRLRTYFSPRFTYGHGSSDASSSSFTNSSSTTTTNAVGGAGSFGAQYGLGDKFSVFGEVGFGGTHGTISSDLSPVKSSSNSWGTRSGVGVIFYF